MIRSWNYDQHQILEDIKTLYVPAGFESDISFGRGAFYKKTERPKHVFDLDPQFDFVKKATSTFLPVRDHSFSSVVFDPPFLTYVKGGRSHREGTSIMASRFSGYWTYEQLSQHYQETLEEVKRVLKPSGILVFKCQDIIHNHRMHCTHYNVIRWAEALNFRLEDIFILAAKHRLPTKAASHGRQKQRHARVFHCYFLVLRRSK